MITPRENPLLDDWTRSLATAGISEARLLSQRFEPDHLGDGEATFDVGAIILRFVRDRGEDYLDVAPRCAPGENFRLDDVFVALGWREIENVVARTHPIPLENELQAIVSHAEDLDAAFGAERLPLTREAVRGAAEKRGVAFLDELRRLADSHDKA